MNHNEPPVANATKFVPAAMAAWTFSTPALAAALDSTARLLPLIEQYPLASAVLVGLAVYGGWVGVTIARLKYSKK